MKSMNSTELLNCIRKHLSPMPLHFEELDLLYVPHQTYQNINVLDYPFLYETNAPNKILFGEKGSGKTTLINYFIRELKNEDFISVYILFKADSFSSAFLLREILIKLLEECINLDKSCEQYQWSYRNFKDILNTLRGSPVTKKVSYTNDIETKANVQANTGILKGSTGAKAKKELTTGSELSIRSIPSAQIEELLSHVIELLNREYGKNLCLIVDDILFEKMPDSQIKKIGDEI